jgi:CRP/FNR family transcriptional regulator
LQRASAANPELMRSVLNAMSTQLASSRDAMLSISTLTADARVADFLLTWAHSLEQRGHRTDHIILSLSRADMGHYLGLTLESVSRALCKLARCGIIEFREKDRRDICIPHLNSLSDFIQDGADQAKPMHAFSARSSATRCRHMAEANYA